MRAARCLVPVFLWLCLSLAGAAEEPSARLTIVTDRPGAVYEAGGTVTFTIELTDGGRPGRTSTAPPHPAGWGRCGRCRHGELAW